MCLRLQKFFEAAGMRQRADEFLIKPKAEVVIGDFAIGENERMKLQECRI
jgi:hypothetical protein